ncbi:MAG: SHOCT domain-containing protein [Stackebrandtia sp.]
MNTFNEAVMAVSEHGGPWMHDGGGGGPWFLLVPLFWIAVVVAIIAIARRRGGPWHRHHGAEGVLRERYARGEVTEEEFRERLQVLRGK